MVRQAIKLAFPGGQNVEVDADVFGEWAVHESQDTAIGRSDWTITHVPSGLAATCAETYRINKRDALRIARHLARAVPHLGIDLGTLRHAAERLHLTGRRDKRFAKLGERIHHEIRVALGLTPGLRAGPEPPS